jgi:hypothetical protein
MFNSVQLPQNRKPVSYSPGLLPICPSENTFLQ